VQVDAPAGNGAVDDGAEASLRLLPDPTLQEQLFAAHSAGKLSVFAFRLLTADVFNRPGYEGFVLLLIW